MKKYGLLARLVNNLVVSHIKNKTNTIKTNPVPHWTLHQVALHLVTNHYKVHALNPYHRHRLDIISNHYTRKLTVMSTFQIYTPINGNFHSNSSNWPKNLTGLITELKTEETEL